jgi:hypothetical protein
MHGMMSIKCELSYCERATSKAEYYTRTSNDVFYNTYMLLARFQGRFLKCGPFGFAIFLRLNMKVIFMKLEFAKLC